MFACIVDKWCFRLCYEHVESKRIRDAALSTFIHHYTFAAKSKSIKYDSRRTI